MKSKRFELIHYIEREDFCYWKRQDNFCQRYFITLTKILLWEKALLKVQFYKNKNIISKYLNNYYELKDLTENYTYLDIDIKFYETFSLARIITPFILNNMKKEGLI